SALFINDQIVVDNDGLHAEQEKSGTLTLEKGKHAIRATFFEKTGKEVFNVSYEGPGFSKKTIPQTVLFLPENKNLASIQEPTQVFINFSNTENAPAPWNNTAADPRYEKKFSNLVDQRGNDTGIQLTIL